MFQSRIRALLVSMDSGVTARARTSDPNPLGPLVAVILVTAIVSGRPGLREFFSRLVRWRVGVKWYAITFATPVLLCLIAVAITFCFVPRRQLSALSIASRFQSVGG